MGLYRLFLAVMVVVSHAGITIGGYNPGVVAVISFYLLSGYVMTVLVEKHYRRIRAVPRFYLDRMARLFPQFLFYAMAAALCIYYAGVVTPYTDQLTPLGVSLNLAMLPLGYYMWWAEGELLIPQAWSLGLEMSFYLVIPWMLILLSKKIMVFFAALSMIVYLVAYRGLIDSDIYGYRLLPGTLFIFIVGSSFSWKDSCSKKFRGFSLVFAGVLLVFAYNNESIYKLPYTKEVLLGLVFGIMALSLLKEKRFSRVDEFFGDLSYGVFLNHFLIIWLMKKYFLIDTFGFVGLSSLISLSCVLAVGSYFLLELPALRWRHKIRHSS